MPKAPVSVSLSAQVGDIHISAAEVAWADVESAAASILALSARLRAKHPELRSIVETVPGGTAATTVVDDDYADEGRRRLGFNVRA